MRNYTVGRGKPPKSSRFKKGRSGNPKGRPKKANRDIYDELDRVLNRKITVRENGRKKQLTVREAQLQTIAAKGLQGDTKASSALLTMQERGQKQRTPEPPSSIEQDDVHILRWHLPRLLKMVNDHDGH